MSESFDTPSNEPALPFPSCVQSFGEETCSSEPPAQARLGATLRPVRQVSEREMALALVLALAQTRMLRFSLMLFYDEDVEFVADLAEELRVGDNKAFHDKLRRVARNLVAGRALYAEMRSTHKEYIGEPAKQMNYCLQPGKARLLTRGKTEHTWEPAKEAAWLIRRAYPEPECV